MKSTLEYSFSIGEEKKNNQSNNALTIEDIFMAYNKFDFTSTDDIKRRHNGHWFSPETMRFFKSRVHSQVYYGDQFIYFVSSESTGPLSDERGYTVRSYCPRTDRIDTVSDFNQYRSRSGAHRAAARIAKGELSHA